MDNMSLSQYYDKLKNDIKTNSISTDTVEDPNTIDLSKPNATNKWNGLVQKNADNIRNNCNRRILINIYANILPLDDEFKKRNSATISGDIDNMLQNKGMDGTQYLKSSFEKTKAPLLEFVLRSSDNLAKLYIKEADEVLKDAKDNDINPRVPETDQVEDQIVDVTSDSEYDNFIDQLKRKTVNKIVDDISDIINDKKEEDNITFNTDKPAMEKTTVSVCMDYMQKHIKEGTDMDTMIGLTIRESTLNQIDVVFNHADATNIRLFESKIFFNKGYIINESIFK